jgi:hypothetical protein
MAYLFVMSACVVCRQPFTYNPLRVPSVVVNGTREPICRACVERANVVRRDRGLPTWPIFDDSYEPVDEHEVPWADDD